MDLFTYIQLLTHTNILPHSSSIQSETSKFLKDLPSAVLISGDLKSWDTIQFSFPLAIQNFNRTTNEKFKNAYIIDMRGQNVSYEDLSPLPRNPKTRFVFVITEQNRSMHETPYFCHALFLTITDHKLETSNSVDHCKGIGSSSAIGHNCSAKVSFLDLPPNVIFDGKKLDGTEGKIFQTTADHLGIDLIFINRHEKGWGHFEPPSGLQGDIATKSTLASFCALYPYLERHHYAELIFADSLSALSWAVPAGIGPSQPTWYIILVTELSPAVWVITFATYFSLIPIATYSKENPNENSSVLMNILGLILGVSQKLILKRGLSLNILVFGFLLTSYYRSIMSSKLTVPAATPEIHTLKELVDTGLQLNGIPSAIGILTDAGNAAPNYPAKAVIAKNFKGALGDLNEMFPKIYNERKIAYLRHEANMYYFIQKNPIHSNRIHIVEEPSQIYYPITMFPKHSCMAARFQDIYQHLWEGGFGSKWTRDLTTYQRAANSNTPLKLAYEHVKGMLLLQLAGWLVSVATFCGEVLFNRIYKRKHKSKQ